MRRLHLGWDSAGMLRENVDDPIMKPLGVDVVQDISDEAPRFAKLQARLLHLVSAPPPHSAPSV